jgi:hypothetical protein
MHFLVRKPCANCAEVAQLKEKNLTLRQSHAQFAHGFAAERGQGVCDSLRGMGQSPIIDCHGRKSESERSDVRRCGQFGCGVIDKGIG